MDGEATFQQICDDIKNRFSWYDDCKKELLDLGFAEDNYDYVKDIDGFTIMVELSTSKNVLGEVSIYFPDSIGPRCCATVGYDLGIGYVLTLASMPRRYARIMCDVFCR